jgi:hypothetical protein
MWTSEAPTEAGWYWYRRTPKGTPEVVCIAYDRLLKEMVQCWIGDAMDDDPKTIKGQWYSEPIKEPLDSAEKVCP